MLRERTVLPRWCSKWSRKARIVGASRSVTRRAEGSIPTVAFTKVNKRRNVSRQLAIVWGLTRLWWQRWSVKKACTWGAMSARGDVMRHAPLAAYCWKRRAAAVKSSGVAVRYQ